MRASQEAASRADDDSSGGERGYPRPQLRRPQWVNLNGAWEFALDEDGSFSSPTELSWERTITVPFAPETEASDIGRTGFFRACWYRRRVRLDAPLKPGERLILHFGAVDYLASVWVNGAPSVTHEGGYTPFKADITDLLRSSDEVEIVVRAEDDAHDLAKPRGKQDWQLVPHSIWYPRTSGIWQTVWMERVPATRIASLRWTPHLARWEIGLEAHIEGKYVPGMRFLVRLSAGDTVLANDSYAIVANEIHRRIALSDPGIDDYRNELLWSPQSPTLIGARVELQDANGVVLDVVHSYTALRSMAIQGDRFVLNGRPFQLRMVLDQGYWERTGTTAPDDSALRRDVELAKEMGFNGVRKHQKLEDPRYLYWADRLGLLVWGEMPSAYRFTTTSVQRVTRQWLEALERDYSHPCVVAWVPLNEPWGVPNLPDSPAERHYVQELYHLTKTVDPFRPVIGNDGWESVATDIIGIHDYDDDPQRIALRYHSHEVRPRLFRRERPGGRMLMLDGHSQPDHPIVLSEFGGIALSREPVSEEWGYSRCPDAKTLAERYQALLQAVRSLDLLAGFCYTQFADTYQEANGLLYADRTPKFPLAQIAAATRGPRFQGDLSMPPAPSTRPSRGEPSEWRMNDLDEF